MRAVLSHFGPGEERFRSILADFWSKSLPLPNLERFTVAIATGFANSQKDHHGQAQRLLHCKLLAAP